MLHWLRSLLNRPGRASAGGKMSKAGILREIHRLEDSNDPARVTTRARLWNRLGTMAERGGDPEVLSCFGKAVDAYLESGYFSAAAALCRRMIRLHPEIVRARCTLAFLSIGNRHLGDAAQEIAEYTMATKRTGTECYAIPRLRLMAAATDDAVVLRRIASALSELGDEEGKDHVLATLAAGPAPHALDQGKHWERLLAVALLNRQQLRRQAEPPPEQMEGSVREAGSVWDAA